MKQQLQQKLRELISDIIYKDSEIDITHNEIELRHLLIALDKVVDTNTGYTVSNLGAVMKNVFDIEDQSMKHYVITKIDLSIPLLDNDEKVLQDLIDLLS